MPPDPVIPIIARRPSIRIDGADAPNLTAGLHSILVAEDTAGLYRCEAEFGNWGDADGGVGFLHFTRRQLEFGRRFDVHVGDTRLFEGRISALSGGFRSGSVPVFRISADDRLQDLRMTRRTRTFADANVDVVARVIASDHGLSVHVDVDAPTMRTLAQLDQSDLSFLREQCRLVGAEAWVDGTSLHVVDRGRRRGNTTTLTYAGSLRELDVSADVASQCTRLTVGGWDVTSKDAASHEASDECLSPDERLGDTGASILEHAFGARHARVTNVNAASAAEAEYLAEAQFRSSARQFVVARGVTDGSRELRVGTHVSLDGIGALFSGAYYIASLRHRFDGEFGFRTEFTAERAWLGRP